MKQAECYWFISDSLRQWETAVVGALAGALLREGYSIRPFAAGGTEVLGIPGLFSWHSLNAMERALIVAAKGKLWHLWGDPPSWWTCIRLRSRTVHTRFDAGKEWKGHPSVLSMSASSGETSIPPVFEMKMTWSASGERGAFREEKTPFFLLPKASEEEHALFEESAKAVSSRVEFQNGALDEGIRSLSSGDCILLLPRPTLSFALLAGFAALMGVSTVAVASPQMDEILGKEGYVRLSTENSDTVQKALRAALGEGGRSASAFARRHVTESFPSERAAKKLKSLYLTLEGEEE